MCDSKQEAIEAVPVVLSADIYHELSDFDQLDLLILLARPEFEIRGIILDQMRSEWGKGRKHSGDYLRSVLTMAGRPDIPVIIGVPQSLTDVEGDVAKFRDCESVQFLLRVMEEQKGLIVFNWASVTDVTAAYLCSDRRQRAGLKCVYGNLGWYKRALYPEPVETGLQKECNVMYDPLAFETAFKNDMPLVWLACNEGAWMFDFARYITDKTGSVARWLSRELYHYHIIRELKSIPRGGHAKYFMTMREELFNQDHPKPGRPLEDPVTELERMDRDDLGSRPIRLYQTGSTYHATCMACGIPPTGIREKREKFDISRQDGVLCFSNYRKDPNGTIILCDQKETVMEGFLSESLQGYFY